MSSVNPPLLLTLLICDQIIREEGTGKFSLIGTFNTLFARSFPCVHPAMAVFAAVTDGRGKVPCCLRLAEVETNKELFALKGAVDFRDPTGVAELAFHIQQVRFEQPGQYAVSFIAGDDLLGSRKLRVQLLPAASKPA